MSNSSGNHRSPLGNGSGSAKAARFRAGAVFIPEHPKAFLTFAIIVAFFIPGLYGTFVSFLPKADYEIGSLGNPPYFSDLPGWDVDLTWIDGAPYGQQLQRVLTAGGTVARLKKDDYKPGRQGPSGSAPEAWGKQWNGNQCLFISSIKLVIVDVVKQTKNINGKLITRTFQDKFHPKAGDDARYVSVDAEKVIADAGSADPASFYLSHLPNSVKNTACLASTQSSGPACPRIVIWAHGTAAPCSIAVF